MHSFAAKAFESKGFKSPNQECTSVMLVDWEVMYCVKVLLVWLDIGGGDFEVGKFNSVSLLRFCLQI